MSDVYLFYICLTEFICIRLRQLLDDSVTSLYWWISPVCSYWLQRGSRASMALFSDMLATIKSSGNCLDWREWKWKTEKTNPHFSKVSGTIFLPLQLVLHSSYNTTVRQTTWNEVSPSFHVSIRQSRYLMSHK